MKRFIRILIAMILIVSFAAFSTGCQGGANGDGSGTDIPSGENTPGENEGGSEGEKPEGKPDEGESEGNKPEGKPDEGGSGSEGGNPSEGGDQDEGGSGNEGGNQGGDGEGTGPDEGESEPKPEPIPGTIKDAELPNYSYESSGEGTYNKELFYKNSYDIPLGDPTVLPVTEGEETWFYVTGTTSGSGFELFKTKNFSDWLYAGMIFTPSETFFGVSSFWAPQLLYDPDASHAYYLGEEESEERGLYILFFSARDEKNVCKTAVAFSKTVNGKYQSFEGVNANGDYIDDSHSLFEMEKLKGLGLYADHIYGDLYKENRSFIDSSPFIDPISGDKYFYMVRSRNVDSSNDVWGVKMKDWVSPDYSTTTPLTSNGYTDISKTERYGYISKNNIDEGPFLYYRDATDDGIDNGKYYLTFSIGDTNDKLYPVCQAMGDSPLGPFTKVQPDGGGFVSCPEDLWDIHGTGHHAFFEVDGELYIAYHTYTVNDKAEVIRRYFAFNRVEWVELDGKLLMRANGPAKAILPLPSSASGYENVAPTASATANGVSADILTDGLVAIKGGDVAESLTITSDTEIFLDFEDWVKARAILIYNSYDYATAFDKIDRIEFSYRKQIDGKYYHGLAFINDLGFNFDTNLIPEAYLTAKGESDMNKLRPMGAAIAEFDEIEISRVRIIIKTDGKEISISEIALLGNVCEDNAIPRGEGEIDASFDPYTAFSDKPPTTDDAPGGVEITIDGKLDEPLWTEHATVIEIEGKYIDAETLEPVDVELYGERHAKVYSYIGDKYIYFAFEVKDKNLFFNASQPQGRSTAVELYFTSIDNKSLNDKCYSVRINPTNNLDELYCNIGAYVGNSAQKEWTRLTILNGVLAAAVVKGTVVTSSTGTSNPENEGYTVEIAIDKSFIGLDATSMRFTAAFVQDRGYDEPRIGNSFIDGTNYVTPITWIVFSNEN